MLLSLDKPKPTQGFLGWARVVLGFPAWKLGDTIDPNNGRDAEVVSVASVFYGCGGWSVGDAGDFPGVTVFFEFFVQVDVLVGYEFSFDI